MLNLNKIISTGLHFITYYNVLHLSYFHIHRDIVLQHFDDEDIICKACDLVAGK